MLIALAFLAACLLVKPARLHFARTARALSGRYMCDVSEATCVSELSCLNFQPRAHWRLTGLAIQVRKKLKRASPVNRKILVSTGMIRDRAVCFLFHPS